MTRPADTFTHYPEDAYEYERWRCGCEYGCERPDPADYDYPAQEDENEEPCPTITTTKGEKFTCADSSMMAFLVWKRFGRDTAAAAVAWRRMLQNSCPDHEFLKLVTYALKADWDSLCESIGCGME